MSTGPIISVIICTFNRGAYWPKAIESLLVQSLDPDDFEILLVDNASTDQTPKLAIEYRKYPHFSYLLEKKQGLSTARNKGISEAKGKYVAFLDDDAIANKQWLSKIIAAFEAHPGVACVGGKNNLIWEKKRPAWVSDGLLPFFGKMDLSAKPRLMQGYEHVYGCNMAFRKDALLEVGAFNEKLGITGEKMLTSEEILVQNDLHRKGYQRFYDPEISVFHYVQSEKVSQSWFLKRFLGQGESIAQMDLIAAQQRGNDLSLKLQQAMDRLEEIIKKDRSPAFQRKGNILIQTGYISHLLSHMDSQSRKKVLLITHGPYLNKDFVVSGNSVRAYYLAKALTEQQIKVVHCYPQELASFSAPVKPMALVKTKIYENKDDLHQIIRAEAADVILVGYWELLANLPISNETPVVVDLSTPRILEQIYQGEDLQTEIKLMMELYPKADAFLGGNQKQRHFLLPWLIMAGFDCSEQVPIIDLPLSAEKSSTPKTHSGEKWQLVSAGTAAAWRNSQAYFDQILAYLQNQNPASAHLSILKGKYIYTPGPDTQEITEDNFSQLPLMPYGEMESFFDKNCHIGLELCEENVERSYSQSFRSIEYLRHGIPIICNDFLEMADYIREFDAGWVVSSPQEIPQLLESIFAAPEAYAQKSVNALRLLDTHFHYAKNAEGLIDFVQNPEKAVKRVMEVALPKKGKEIPAGKMVVRVLSGWEE